MELVADKSLHRQHGDFSTYQTDYTPFPVGELSCKEKDGKMREKHVKISNLKKLTPP